MRINVLAAFAALAMVAAPAAAQVTTYDANPTVAFTYGSGNGYTPANAVVNTTTTGNGTTGELAVRAHVSAPGAQAASTGGTGIYTFALNTAHVGFDYSFFGSDLEGATVTLTNLLTSDKASFAAALLGGVQPSTALQNSEQFGFGFLNGNFPTFGNLKFDNSINNTYRIDLTGGGQTATAFAQFGTGAVAAVPEPATWAMMLLGFGVMGGALRRRKRPTQITQTA